MRLRGFDYASTCTCFVTIVVQDRCCLLGEPSEDSVRLKPAGEMVAGVWRSLENRFTDVTLDGFVVMPNHIHGIVALASRECAHDEGASSSWSRSETGSTRSGLGVVMGAFKSLTTVAYVGSGNSAH